MPATLTLAKATPADLPALSCLEQSRQRYPWSEGQIATSLEQHEVLCLRHSNTAPKPPQALRMVITKTNEETLDLYGYVILRQVGAGEGELLNIVTAASGAGYGRLLWQGVRHWMQEEAVLTLYLEVARHNQQALLVYQHWGFRLIGERKGYYHDGSGKDDALVMRWP